MFNLNAVLRPKQTRVTPGNTNRGFVSIPNTEEQLLHEAIQQPNQEEEEQHWEAPGAGMSIRSILCVAGGIMLTATATMVGTGILLRQGGRSSSILQSMGQTNQASGNLSNWISSNSLDRDTSSSLDRIMPPSVYAKKLYTSLQEHAAADGVMEFPNNSTMALLLLMEEMDTTGITPEKVLVEMNIKETYPEIYQKMVGKFEWLKSLNNIPLYFVKNAEQPNQEESEKLPNNREKREYLATLSAVALNKEENGQVSASTLERYEDYYKMAAMNSNRARVEYAKGFNTTEPAHSERLMWFSNELKSKEKRDKVETGNMDVLQILDAIWSQEVLDKQYASSSSEHSTKELCTDPTWYQFWRWGQKC